MGHVYIRAKVETPIEETSNEYEFLVDTGSSYMVLREKEFKELKLKPIFKTKSNLADNRSIEVPIVPVKVKAMGREAGFCSVNGFPMHLFGAFTLEALGLAVDPSTGEVKASRPVALLL